MGNFYVRSCRLNDAILQNMLDESASKRPLISDSMPISALREEYENGSGSFVKQIDYLRSQGFIGVRRTRGDGDCFYRCKSFVALASPTLDEYEYSCKFSTRIRLD